MPGGGASDNEAGTVGPADASVVKLFYSELLQRLTDFGAEIGGLAAHTRLTKPMSSGWESGCWVLDFIGSWEWTIPGGASEIQRTIIGERGLGLPPRAERRLMSSRASRSSTTSYVRWQAICSPRTRVVDWPVLVDAGWVGLEVPENSAVRARRSSKSAIVCEEMGRAASTNSYLGSAVLTVGALNALQPSEISRPTAERHRSRHRPGWPSPSGRSHSTATSAVVRGATEFVPDADGADRLLVVATDPTASRSSSTTVAATIDAQPGDRR